MAAQPVKKSMTFLALAALGVVFGDIGTSPLYSFQTALWSITSPDQSSVLGIASLIIWCLLLLVTVKYMFVSSGISVGFFQTERAGWSSSLPQKKRMRIL
jgi:K+ transporter